MVELELIMEEMEKKNRIEELEENIKVNIRSIKPSVQQAKLIAKSIYRKTEMLSDEPALPGTERAFCEMNKELISSICNEMDRLSNELRIISKCSVNMMFDREKAEIATEIGNREEK